MMLPTLDTVPCMYDQESVSTMWRGAMPLLVKHTVTLHTWRHYCWLTFILRVVPAVVAEEKLGRVHDGR